MLCKHCNEYFYVTHGQFANHVRWCNKNPKAIEFRKQNRDKLHFQIDKKFGVKKSFDVICKICSNQFQVKERELLFPSKSEYYCSKSCSCSVGGAVTRERYYPDEKVHYTIVAWRHHKKECIICKEHKIVTVHHYNGDHQDDRPENLVPLCPTHHQYMHSKFRNLISKQVDEYVRNFGLVVQREDNSLAPN